MRYIVRTVDFKPERLENVELLKTIIPQLEVIVDTQKDGYKSYFKGLELLNDTGGVFLEDDVLLCKDFMNRIESIINHKGCLELYNFFENPKVPSITSYRGGSKFFSCVCSYIPKGFADLVIKEYDVFKRDKPSLHQGMATDRLVPYVLVKNKIKYWHIRPCLVQHLAFKSAIGNRPTNRQTTFFIDDLPEYNDLTPQEITLKIFNEV